MSGSPFGKYLLYERIAAGGMAEIYRAKYAAAAGVTKQVVIKKILPHYAGNRNFVSMFINEAKIAMGLSHGNIAQVFDFGEIDGEYFLAMEYVHGQTISKIMRRAREKGLNIPPPYVALIGMEMCRGLHYAHTRVDEQQRPLNIVHRDVSPQNVIVSYEGQVKLVDFGIAKARSASDVDKTQAGAIKGKYVYFSPEQARAKDLDGRSDVFATGICLYEMLCGRLPFEGKMVEVLNKIVRGDFQRPSKINADVDPQLEAVLLKSMATSRDDRYVSALGFQEALAGYLVTVAPRFNQSSLAQLVDFLFVEELEAEGRHVDVAPDFLEQVAHWKDPETAQVQVGASPPQPELTSAERRSAMRSSARPSELSEPGPQHTGSVFRGRRFGTAPLLALFALAVALGSGLVIWLGRPRTFGVRLTSVPTGAAVHVDGADTGQQTPATILGLVASQPHEVELVSAGMRPWRRPVSGSGNAVLELDAQLEKEPSAVVTKPPLPVAPAAVHPEHIDEAARDQPPAPPPAATASYPATTLKMEAATLAVSIPGSRAARIRLNPRKSYRLTVEGMASLDEVGRTRGAFYFTEREPTSSGPAFGWVGPHDVARLTGVRVLYGFLIDATPSDNAGAVTLVAREGRTTTRLTVDARSNAIWPEAGHGATFAGLAQHGRFVAELKGRANMGVGAGGVDRALFWYDGNVDLALLGRNPDLTHGVLRVGKPVTLENPTGLLIFIPDDDPLDNSGGLTLTLKPRR
jgi:serine/threonine protein kinase